MTFILSMMRVLVAKALDSIARPSIHSPMWYSEKISWRDTTTRTTKAWAAGWTASGFGMLQCSSFLTWPGGTSRGFADRRGTGGENSGLLVGFGTKDFLVVLNTTTGAVHATGLQLRRTALPKVFQAQVIKWIHQQDGQLHVEVTSNKGRTRSHFVATSSTSAGNGVPVFAQLGGLNSAELAAVDGPVMVPPRSIFLDPPNLGPMEPFARLQAARALLGQKNVDRVLEMLAQDEEAMSRVPNDGDSTAHETSSLTAAAAAARTSSPREDVDEEEEEASAAPVRSEGTPEASIHAPLSKASSPSSGAAMQVAEPDEAGAAQEQDDLAVIPFTISVEDMSQQARDGVLPKAPSTAPTLSNASFATGSEQTASWQSRSSTSLEPYEVVGVPASLKHDASQPAGADANSLQHASDGSHNSQSDISFTVSSNTDSLTSVQSTEGLESSTLQKQSVSTSRDAEAEEAAKAAEVAEIAEAAETAAETAEAAAEAAAAASDAAAAAAAVTEPLKLPLHSLGKADLRTALTDPDAAERADALFARQVGSARPPAAVPASPPTPLPTQLLATFTEPFAASETAPASSAGTVSEQQADQLSDGERTVSGGMVAAAEREQRFGMASAADAALWRAQGDTGVAEAHSDALKQDWRVQGRARVPLEEAPKSFGPVRSGLPAFGRALSQSSSATPGESAAAHGLNLQRSSSQKEAEATTETDEAGFFR